MHKHQKIEWISLLYLALFVFAILSPSLVNVGWLGVSEEHWEEILIFIFGISGLVAFSVYERVMEKKDSEREEAISDRDRARRELVSSYEYIGGVNRRIEALKKLANQTVSSMTSDDTEGKAVFQSIVASAAAIIRAKHGVLRVVSFDKLRTLKEYVVDPDVVVKVSNKDLLDIHHEKRSHSFVRDESGSEVLVVPSSKTGSGSKVFLILSTSPDEMPDVDPELLRAYANQAEVLYRVLAQKAG